MMIRSAYNRYIVLGSMLVFIAGTAFVSQDYMLVYGVVAGLSQLLFRCPYCNTLTIKILDGLVGPPIFKKCDGCDYRYK